MRKRHVPPPGKTSYGIGVDITQLNAMNPSRARQMEIFSRMTPEKKWEIVACLEREARALCRSRLQRQHPDWDEARLELEVKRWWIHASA